MTHERRLALPSATALVVANMIGVGIFTTSGFALADLGSPDYVLLAWIVAGVIALFGALSYGALARHITESGGEYTFLSRTIHPLAGFLAGWVSLLAGFTGPIAASAHGLGLYMEDELGIGARWIASGALLLVGLQHGLRLKLGVLVQNGVVLLKLVGLAAFVFWASGRLTGGPGSDLGTPGVEPPSAGAFAVALVWISLSYSGWNAAVYLAGEVRSPEKNVPRALLLGALATTILYLALNFCFVYATSDSSALAGRPDIAAAAAEVLGGATARRAVTALVVVALATSISSMAMIGPRVYERMSEDGLFPRFFQRQNEVPGRAVAVQIALALVVVWISELSELLAGLGFVLGLSAATTVAGLLVLRRRLGPEKVPAFGAPFIPGLYIAATLASSIWMAAREPRVAGIAAVLVAAGVPLYALFRKRA